MILAILEWWRQVVPDLFERCLKAGGEPLKALWDASADIRSTDEE